MFLILLCFFMGVILSMIPIEIKNNTTSLGRNIRLFLFALPVPLLMYLLLILLALIFGATTAGMTGVFMVIASALRALPNGSYQHQTKKGKRDLRYKKNKYIDRTISDPQLIWIFVAATVAYYFAIEIISGKNFIMHLYAIDPYIDLRKVGFLK